MEAKKLFEILKGDQLVATKGVNTKEVNSIIIDSRKAKEGACYIAIKGFKTDGHDYIDDVIANGVSFVVCEKMPANIDKYVIYHLVKDCRTSMALLAHQFYNKPSSKMVLVGVTGTNGKTTIATLLYQLYTSLGKKCGLISTVENVIADKIIVSTHTTPDAISLAALMQQMYEEGCSHVFMEVSSHALDQKRTLGIDFKVAIFSNITHDHLDYHKTFLSYINAKKLFFDNLSKTSFAVINADDKNGKVMIQNCNAKPITYALHTRADFQCRVLSDEITGLHLKINNREALCMMTGAFNAYNLTAALATASALGENEEEVLNLLSGLTGAEGRMEKVVDKVSGKVGIVDYAHTPDALENVLKTIKSSAHAKQIITVVGCGGDRDAAKRPIMAEIAARYSNKVVLTSDNPRSEDPEKILDGMEVGLKADQKNKCLRITDRLMAIKTAVLLASHGDIILIAGKGHEKYQEINGQKLPFEDKKILLEAFSGNV